MKFGWDIYAPDAKTRKEPCAAPLQASIEQLRGLLLALQDFGVKGIRAMPQRYQQLEAVENGVVSRIHIHDAS
jgi:hypothetical protein